MTTSLRYLLLITLLASATFTKAQDIAKAALEEAVKAGFTEVERQLLRKYLGEQVVVSKETTQDVTSNKKGNKGKKGKKGRGGMPPGLAKKDKLPPGLAKQLQKNGSLPPGLAKRNLPSDVEKQLPPVPEGYERQIVEDAAVVLVHKATGKIIDTVLGKLLD